MGLMKLLGYMYRAVQVFVHATVHEADNLHFFRRLHTSNLQTSHSKRIQKVFILSIQGQAVQELVRLLIYMQRTIPAIVLTIVHRATKFRVVHRV